MSKIGLISAVILVLALLLTGCSTSTPTNTPIPTQGPTPTQPPTPTIKPGVTSQPTVTLVPTPLASKTLKVGMSAILSGPGAAWGLQMKWGAEEAISRVNKAGGVAVNGQPYVLQLIAYDSKNTSADGRKAAERLAYLDKVDMVITIGATPTLPLQEVTEPLGILHFAIGWGKDLLGQQKPYSFRVANTGLEIGRSLAPWLAAKYPQAKTVAIANPDDQGGRASSDVSRALWPQSGLKVVAEQFFAPGLVDAQPLATKLLSLAPDVLDLGAAGQADVGLILKALHLSGWNGIKLHPAMTTPKSVIDVSGLEAAEGLYAGLTADFEGPTSTPLQRELASKIRTDIKMELGAVSLNCYDAVNFYVESIKKVNSVNNADLIKALPGMILHSTSGEAAFGGASDYGVPRQLLMPVSISQVRGGKMVDVITTVPKELDEKLQLLKG